MSLLKALNKIVENPSKRLGRGPGSGKGKHTVGRGNKGQRARKSGTPPLWFEGGQLPLVKRVPMQRGKGRFNVLFPTAAVSLAEVEKMSADIITLDALKLEGVIDKRFRKAKIITNGSLTRKVTVRGIAVSKTASTIIERAGGTIEN
jgi:large subunit ribosomal protein L15